MSSWTYKLWTQIEAYHEKTDTYKIIEGYYVCLGEESVLVTLLHKLYFMVKRHRPSMATLAEINRWIKENAEATMAELEAEVKDE